MAKNTQNETTAPTKWPIVRKIVFILGQKVGTSALIMADLGSGWGQAEVVWCGPCVWLLRPWQSRPWRIRPWQIRPWQIRPWQIRPWQIRPWRPWQIRPWQIRPWQIHPSFPKPAGGDFPASRSQNCEWELGESEKPT